MFGEPDTGDAALPPRMRPDDVDTAERPVVLVWEVTRACSLACEHCRAEATPRRHSDELTTAEGEVLLEEAATFGDGQLVVLSGGDPLVRDDLEHLVAYGTDLGLRMTLTPSGTDSLTRERVEALADAGLQRMGLSLDGATPDAHDAFRGERGSFESTLRAARYAADAGLPVQVNTTVCDATVEELPGLRDVVRDLDAVLWSVFFLVAVGRGRLLDPVDPERADRVMDWLDAVRGAEPYAVKTTEAPQYRRVVLQKCRAESAHRSSSGGEAPAVVAGRRGGVRAGSGFAFVSHVGDVYPSGFLPESVGNVREESVVDV